MCSSSPLNIAHLYLCNELSSLPPLVHQFEEFYLEWNWCYVPFRAVFWIPNGFTKLTEPLGRWPGSNVVNAQIQSLQLWMNKVHRGSDFRQKRGDYALQKYFFFLTQHSEEANWKELWAPNFAAQSFDKISPQLQKLKNFLTTWDLEELIKEDASAPKRVQTRKVILTSSSTGSRNCHQQFKRLYFPFGQVEMTKLII